MKIEYLKELLKLANTKSFSKTAEKLEYPGAAEPHSGKSETDNPEQETAALL